MKKLSSILFPLILLWGCSAHQADKIPESVRKLKNLSVIPADAKPAYHIKFVPVVTFKDTGNVFINNYDEMAVDEKGRVYVTGRLTINIFDPDGHYMTHLGRKGKGPGEFENLGDANMQVQSNQLYVYDNRIRRINIFSLNLLDFLRTVVISPDKWSEIKSLQKSSFRHFFVRNDGSFLMGFTKSVMEPEYFHYYLADSTGHVEPDQIFRRKYVNLIYSLGPGFTISPPTPASSPILSSNRSSLMAVSKDGHIFSAWTEDFLIKEYAPDGKYQRAIYHPYKKPPINPDEIMSQYKRGSVRYLNNVRNAIQDTWPAISYMIFDNQNRLWVATFTNDKNQYQWWVLDPSGKLLAKFKWPGKRAERAFMPRHIRLVKNGFLYAFKSDTSAGTSEIVKYRIDMK